MGLDRINIGNGIYINFAESDKFKTNFIEINIISRLEDDFKASKNALLSKVLMRGSKNFPTMAEINKRLDYLYAAKIGCYTDKIGEAHVLGLFAYMLENKYAIDGGADVAGETINMLGDIFMNPLIENGGFKSEYVETEKINLTNDILAQINDKNAYVYKKCIEKMCAGEKFATENKGSIESVKLIDGKILYGHYNYILSNCAVEIFCVGKFDKSFIADKFKGLLKNLKRETIENYETEVILKAGYKGETIEEMEVNQGKLAMGFRIGTSNKAQDFAKFVLFDTVYASTPNGKLFQNVREKLSLCYYCQTAVEPAKGIVTVLCGIEPGNKQKAADEILAQLEEMKAGNFTDKDIEVAKLYDINSYKGIYDSAGDTASWYKRRLMSGVMKTPEQAIEDINKVTREDIIESANKLTLDTIYFLKGSGENNNV
jgi:predicted Zn-dependent peptidase